MERAESRGAQYAGKAIVLCLGNPYMKDDAAGVQVARRLMEMNLGKDVVIESSQSADLSLLSGFGGADMVIVVDTLRSGTSPGTISKYVISPAKIQLSSLPGSHSIRLHDMFDLANQAGLLNCPVSIVGIEPRETTLGEGLSPEVQSAIPRVLGIIIRELNLDPGLLPNKTRDTRHS
jgi:hydrogenase maturation protease